MARGFIALAIVIALIIGVVVLGKSKPTDSTTKDSGITPVPPSAAKTISPEIEVEGPAKIVLECETPAKLEDKASNGTIVMKMGKAQMGKTIGYLEIPDGWIKTCGLEDTVKPKDTGGMLPGKAHYEFEVASAGTYYIAVRAKWFDSCGNSTWIKVGEQPFLALEDTIGELSVNSYKWAWHPVQELAKSKGFKLEAGKHTLVLATKEDGPQFDKILIASDATVPPDEEVDP